MKIDALNHHGTLNRGESPSIQALESRLIAAGLELPGSQRPDPEFERLYQHLLTMEGQGNKAIYEYLRSLRGADGESPAYPTAKALMAVTLQVLVRLKDENQQDSLLYKEVSGANALAFSMDLLVKGYMREVFEPMGDEVWEKSEW